MVARTWRNDIVGLYELREGLEVYTADKVGQSQLNAPHMSVLSGLSVNMRTLAEELMRSGQERLDTYDQRERQHEMNRLMRLPSQIPEELDRMRLGGQGGKNTGRRHQRRAGNR
jgi:hypothetical protein